MPTPGTINTPAIAHRSRAAAAARIALGAILMITAMAIPQAAAPASVEAASCTGWTSRTVPPKTIRVLRTDKGRVQRVDFRAYVAKVMASGEWPSRLRRATLEAGAVATKQYAWYYTLKGNHRPGYRHGGRCYDVRDDTMDQLFRPARANPTAKQQRAINRTWGLTLRKGGRFFLTGYRAGVSGTCAADANGWKLYARSVEACAAKGWSYKRILKRYLNPKLTMTWSNRLGPVLKKPSFNLKKGTHLERGAATVKWRPARPKADVAKYVIQRKVGKKAWKRLDLGSNTQRIKRAWVRLGTNNRFRVKGKDSKGRSGPWAYSAKRKPNIRGPVGISLSGDGYDPSSDPAKVKIRFEGRSVAFMTRVGPKMGKARVFLNGRNVATVDLRRSKVTDAALVWTRNFSRTKPRTIVVKAVDPAARVDFDGFFILR